MSSAPASRPGRRSMNNRITTAYHGLRGWNVIIAGFETETEARAVSDTVQAAYDRGRRDERTECVRALVANGYQKAAEFLKGI